MSLGNALLQPSVFERDSGDPIQGLVEDFGRLIAIFVEDATAEGPMAGEIVGAIDEVSQTLTTWFTAQEDGQTRQDKAMARLTGRIAPIEAFVTGLVNDVGAGGGDPAAIIASIRQVFELASGAASAANLTVIRAELQFIRDLLEEDLGFSPQFMNDRISEMFSALNRRLGEMPAPVDADARRRLNLARAILGRLSLRAHMFTPPDPDLEPLARVIHEALRSSGVTDILERVACAIDGIEAALNAAILAGEAVATDPQPINAGVASKDDHAEYSYYASWLLKNEYLPMLGLTDIDNELDFMGKLQNSDHEVIQVLRNTMDEDLRKRLREWGGGSSDKEFRLELLAAINKKIQEKPILNIAPASTIPDTKLTEDIRNLRRDYLKDQSLFMYNRRVVELAFGDCLDTYFSGGVFWQGLARWFLVSTGYPRNQVFVTGDRKFVMCDDIPLHFGKKLEWHQAPMFAGEILGGMWFRFDNISKEFCEHWAKWVSLAAETAKAIWHTMMIQPGHEAQNALLCSIEYADLLQQFLWGKPLSAYGLEKNRHTRRVLKLLDGAFGIKGVSTLVTTFQVPQNPGTREWGLFWLTIFGGDFFRGLTPIIWSNKGADLLISSVTLINFGGERNGPMHMPTNPPYNHQKQEAWVGLSDMLYLILLVAQYPQERYSIDLWRGGTAATGEDRAIYFAGHWLGGGVGIGMAAGLSGSIIAQVWARSIDLKRLFATMGWSALRCYLQYPFYNYKLRENATDGGTYSPRAPVVLRGYPPRESSPYLLPYPGGTSHYAGQGNMGLFSHNNISSGGVAAAGGGIGTEDQNYAYDFSHDFLEPISCIRSGIVWRAPVEGNADGNETNGNNLIILHDGPPDPVHDDYGAGAVRTFSYYWHLAQNGVTNAPAFGGATPAVGTAVAQGDLIALAGDTGISFHNHLHLQVIPATVASSGTMNPQPDTFTIPFVFRDGQNGLLPGDGNLRSTTWHRSENV